MKTIWKYLLEIKDTQFIEAPVGAKFMSVIEQGGNPVLYALATPGAPFWSFEIKMRGTERPVEESLLKDFAFLGTVVAAMGLV